MTIEFTGKVIAALPLQSGMGQRGPWSRATVVFEIQDGGYSQKLACENSNEAERYSKLPIGSVVHVKANVSSREYQGKWYTTAQCYEFAQQGAQQQQPTYQAPPTGGQPF